MQQGKIFFEKLPVAELFKRKSMPPMIFYGKKLSLIVFCSKRNYLEISHTIFEKLDFLRKKTTPPILFYL
jgi:hypothetical protein